MRAGDLQKKKNNNNNEERDQLHSAIAPGSNG